MDFYLVFQISYQLQFLYFHPSYCILQFFEKNRTINIDVITMMPPRIIGKSDTNVEGELNPISVPDINVTLHPATIYIDTDPNISEINSISGSLLETKKL